MYRSSIRALLVSLACSVTTTTASADADAPKEYQSAIIFRHINDVIPPGRVRLSNGVEVLRSDWPALLMARIPVPGFDKPRTCTGALVGPNVVLLAAHCVDSWDGSVRRSELWIASRRVRLVCETHPAYRRAEYRFSEPRSSEDFALCLLDNGDMPLPAFDKLLFEVIDVATIPSASEPVLMTGWGCDKLTMAPNGVLNWTPRTDALRIGDSRLDTIIGQWAASPAYVTTIAVGTRDVALCPGDSGGPVFTGATANQPGGARRIRGVNSKVCTRRAGDTQLCTLGTGFGQWSIVSSMSATAYKSFAGWATDWASRQDAKKPVICGVNRNAGEPPCRD